MVIIIKDIAVTALHKCTIIWSYRIVSLSCNNVFSGPEGDEYVTLHSYKLQ